MKALLFFLVNIATTVALATGVSLAVWHVASHPERYAQHLDPAWLEWLGGVPPATGQTSTASGEPADAGAPAAAPVARPLVIAAGEPGDVYYDVAAALCRLVNAAPGNGVRCMRETSHGGVDNLGRIAAGAVDFGIVQADRARHAFATGSSGLRSVLTLHEESLAVVTRDPDVASVADLSGARIALGVTDSGHADTAREVLVSFGLDAETASAALRLDARHMPAALCDGGIDAFAIVTGHPARVVAEALDRCNARLLGFEAVTPLAGGTLVPVEIPASSYVGQLEPVATVGGRAVLAAPATLDAGLVRRFLAAVLADRDQLSLQFEALPAAGPPVAPDAAVLPVHDGARAYFDTRVRDVEAAADS